MTVLDIFQFLAVFASGIAAGTLVTVLMAIGPIFRRLPPVEALRVKRMFDPLLDRYQPAMVILSAVSAVVILIGYELTTSETVCTAIGLAGALGVGLTSSVNLRINRVMGSWPPDEVRPEFAALLARWSRMHNPRTLAGVVGFAGFALALINP